MGYKVLSDGSIQADTAAEAIEVAKLMQGGAKAPTPADGNKTHKPAGNPLSDEQVRDIAATFKDWVVPAAYKFLAAIMESPPGGATAEVMMRALGIDNPKAFGGQSAAINKLIQRCGFTLEHVYETTSTAGGRFWRARPKIAEALELVRRMRAYSLL